MNKNSKFTRQRKPIGDGLAWLGSAVQDLREAYAPGDVLRLSDMLPDSLGANAIVQETRLRFLAGFGVVKMASEFTEEDHEFIGFTWTLKEEPELPRSQRSETGADGGEGSPMAEGEEA